MKLIKQDFRGWEKFGRINAPAKVNEDFIYCASCRREIPKVGGYLESYFYYMEIFKEAVKSDA